MIQGERWLRDSVSGMSIRLAEVNLQLKAISSVLDGLCICPNWAAWLKVELDDARAGAVEVQREQYYAFS